MHFDFRFFNSSGKWESKGHRRGADCAAAIRAMESAGLDVPAGNYMSRPRGRQKDWDLFSIDRDGQITQAPRPGSGPTGRPSRVTPVAISSS